ncbi:hypothetical protein O181_002958 [Austropuccinia psidii MF-1]|uniref:Integrase catalytic domain-containing protein n=1 Tax=Austropuccinia psidii MF-1 TaxID=1389203 RepID=A0A9Q3BDQ7_9BASI|nr:hypothetical protein [Austropuccinia psidii MF-1]
MPNTPSSLKDSSSEEEVIKAKMVKLTRTNWVQWSCQFENFLISKGMEDLFDFPSEDTKSTINFKKKNSGALTLLWSSVSTEFKGVLLNNKSSFYNCWISLGSCCGKNSIVVICRTLQELVNLKFEHGSSLEMNVDEFNKVHASYLSISDGSTFSMNLLSSMAEAFFLQNLDNNGELSSLCQTLYDIKPLDLNTKTNRVAIEHSRFQSSYDHALMFDKNEQANSTKPKKKYQPEASNSKKKAFKDKKKGKNTNQGTNQKNHEQDTNKRFEKIENLLEKLKSATNLCSINATSGPKDLTQQTESDSESFIFEVNALVEKCNQGSIYLASGAGKTVVNQLLLLEDPKPVKKQINTFSNPVKVTHQGTLNFKGVKIYPIYYVPCGPVNLLSASQLCDHGIKLISKSNLFIVKYSNCIVDTFHREGNLFVSKLQVDSVHAMPSTAPDWHLNLGHSSDSYIKALLKEGHISGTFTESLKFPVYQQAKIKNFPHSKMLPCSNSPFFKIHMDTLQTNPPTCITPAFLHTDRGGEFNSHLFLSYLNTEGISLERGPPESPQTNGVAERFNQTLLSKVTTKIINPSSKIEPRGEVLWGPTFKKYSDGLQLLNLETGKIRVSQDFTPTVINPTLSINQPQQVLPTTSSLTVKLQIPTLEKQPIIKQENLTNTCLSDVPSFDSPQLVS